MNTQLIQAIGAVASRLIDKKKLAGKTTATTAVAAGGATGAFMLLIQSEDTVTRIIGAVAIAVCGMLSMYQESKK